MSASVNEDYDYLIDKSGSNITVKNGNTGLLEISMTSTDAAVTFAAVRDAMGNSGKVCIVKSGKIYTFNSSVTLDGATSQYQTWKSSGGKWSLAQLRAGGNFPVFIITNGQSPIGELQNLYLSHNQAIYTTGLIRFLDSVSEVNIDGLRFSGFSNNVGDAILFDLQTDLRQQFRIALQNCNVYGLDNFLHFNSTHAGTASNNFINGIHITKNFITNTKRVSKYDGVSGAVFSGHIYEKCEYQWITGNDPGAGGAVYDFNGDPNLSCTQIRMTDCLTWDIPANINFMNTNNNTEYSLKDCHPTARIGGSGFIEGKGQRYDLYTQRAGTSTFSANGITKDFAITHGLGLLPRKILVEAASDDAGIIPCYAKRDSTLTTTSMTVSFLKAPKAANPSNNIVIKWIVFY